MVYLDSNGFASGHLFLDDGDSLGIYDRYDDEEGQYNELEFSCETTDHRGILTSKIKHWGFNGEEAGVTMTLDYVAILGVESNPNQVAVNGQTVEHYYDKNIKVSVSR